MPGSLHAVRDFPSLPQARRERIQSDLHSLLFLAIHLRTRLMVATDVLLPVLKLNSRFST